MISRRRLLIDGAISVGLGRYAWSEEFAPVELEFPGVELDAELPLVAGANTSGYTTCQVQVLQTDGKMVWQSKEWGTEPNKSNSAATPRLGGSGEKKHVVRAVMRPTRSTVPSMSVAVHQGTDVDKTQIEMLAEQARFVTDPAQRPTGGHFAITLYFDSTVTLQIWSGNSARGTPVFQAQSHNVQAGGNRVPWDLHTKSGYAAPGRYVALLTCSPNQEGRAATFLGSSFGVI
jgi:hypothetical protein